MSFTVAMQSIDSARWNFIAQVTFVFFFQAEDGIRDDLVTGVQTCALPISLVSNEQKAGWQRWELEAPFIATTQAIVRDAFSRKNLPHGPCQIGASHRQLWSDRKSVV